MNEKPPRRKRAPSPTGATQHSQSPTAFSREGRVAVTAAPAAGGTSEQPSERTSASDPPSANSTSDVGYERINFALRSVLFHPVALLMLSFFIGDDTKKSQESKNKDESSSSSVDKREEKGDDEKVDDSDDDNNDNEDTNAKASSCETLNDVNPGEGLRGFLHQLCARNTKDDDGNNNEGGGRKTKASAAFSRFFSNDVVGPRQRFDGVLQLSYASFKQRAMETKSDSRSGATEHFLTEKIYENITKEFGSDSATSPALQVCHQHKVLYHPAVDSAARTDILIHHRRDKDCNKSGIALLLEVGLEKQKKKSEDDLVWWKKVDQNAQYLKHFQDPINQESEVQFLGPMLFAVLTIVQAKGGEAAAGFQSALLGVFLCVPRAASSAATGRKPSPGFRAALLRRDEFDSLEDASRGLGKVLRATRALAGLLQDVDGGCVFDDYEFLGPNCSRIGDKVFRAYDSRFRHTHRRPDLYGDKDIEPHAEVVCRILDKNLAHRKVDGEFQLWDDRDPVTELSDKRLWLWQFKGEVLVIAIAYHPGRHFATLPTDFIPVIDFLQTLHGKRYIHGDIRCANIAFPTRLIDFDMGGRVSADNPDDSPKYPPGYVRKLDDGNRRGNEGEPMKQSDDWYALLEVIFAVHKLRPPEPPGKTSNELLARFHSVSKLPPDDAAIPERVIELKRFLNAVAVENDDVKPWAFSYDDSFKRFVNKWIDSPEQRRAPPRETIDPATGSPQKPNVCS